MCTHTPDTVLVTNQPDRHDSHRPLLAQWVCGSRACVSAAIAEVEAFTGERAYWRIGPNHEGHQWRTTAPEGDVHR